MEIERKFLLKQIPENLNAYPCHLIEQAYLCTDPVVRIRREDDTYYMTYKGSGLMSREEYNLPLNKEAYEHLLSKADGNVISKKRYLIPLSGDEINPECLSYLGDTPIMIELDEFAPPFAPLFLAEVEFPNEEAALAFRMPNWFSEDVTQDIRYHNSYLSTAPSSQPLRSLPVSPLENPRLRCPLERINGTLSEE